MTPFEVTNSYEEKDFEINVYGLEMWITKSRRMSTIKREPPGIYHSEDFVEINGTTRRASSDNDEYRIDLSARKKDHQEKKEEKSQVSE